MTAGIPIRKSWNILDAGCGTGADTIYLSKFGYHVVGVDILPSNIWKQRENTDYVICDVLRLPFREDCFGLVIAKDLLHHLHKERVREALAELKRVTLRGGFLRVIEANRYHINSILVSKENPVHDHFSKEEFERLMGLGDYSGFELLPWLYKYRNSDLPWYTLVITLKLVTKVRYMFKVILSILDKKQRSRVLKRYVTYFVWTYPPLKMKKTREG